MVYIYVYTSSIYACQIFGIYDQFGGHICYWHIFDNNMKCIAVECVFAYVFKMLGVYAYLA